MHFNVIHTFLVYVVTRPAKQLLYVKSVTLKGSLKQATFSSHGRQPEVNILQARPLVSPRFLN